MAKDHKIGWLNLPGYIPETWNPIIGCSKVSLGCDNCYAERMANRLAGIAGNLEYASVIQSDSNKWNGKTSLVEGALTKPLLWKSARMVFVCSMSDLFHETTPFEWIDAIFSVMSDNDQHIYVLLTKRPDVILEFFCWKILRSGYNWRPKDNIWFGVTAENQEQANKRIPLLLKVPCAKRFVSVEPMLGPIDFYEPIISGEHYNTLKGFGDISGARGYGGGPALDWVICGGESGPKARPVHPDWVRSVRDQCKAADVPFFFKQWGEWLPTRYGGDGSAEFNWCEKKLPYQWMCKVGRNKAGNLLDGQQHQEWPTPKFKISSGACVYHACMDDGCQKQYMLQNGNYGLGDCEKPKTT